MLIRANSRVSGGRLSRRPPSRIMISGLAVAPNTIWPCRMEKNGAALGSSPR